MLAHKTPFIVDRLVKIEPLGKCAYAVSGTTDGAILREHLTIVDCKHLTNIITPREETWTLGAIGDTAVLNDMCCMGRPNVYRPATIVRVNLATGHLSPEIDLTPEPERYPADRRPIGQGSSTMLVGSRIYLGVGTSLYVYEDISALAGRTPRRIIDTLTEPPEPLGDGFIAVHVRDARGPVDEILDLKHDPLRVLWSERSSEAAIYGYDATPPKAVELLSTTPDTRALVRLSDAMSLVIPKGCIWIYDRRRDACDDLYDAEARRQSLSAIRGRVSLAFVEPLRPHPFASRCAAADAAFSGR